LAHFVSSFISESYRADIGGWDTRINKGCNSVCYNAGFAAARAGNDKQWAFNVKNGFSLRISKLLGYCVAHKIKFAEKIIVIAGIAS
jgi:hypothetical protein